MSTPTASDGRPRIAVVGSGVSGLVTAWLLRRRAQVTVYEADDRIGGHVHTHDIEVGGVRTRVDTGFIVFNPRNYTHFCRLLERLGVASRETDMSLSVCEPATGFEYSGDGPRGLFARRRNLLDAGFWRLIADAVRFRRLSADALTADPEVTLGAYLRSRRFSERFIRHLVVPMAAAVWSLPEGKVLDLPAAFSVRFFHHHGFLDAVDRPVWRTVVGGSATYVERLVRDLADVRPATPVRRVVRGADGAIVTTDAGDERYDHVVLACHADQSLALLADADADERALLAAFPYQRNEVLLHTDARVMPRRRAAWAAWNYRMPPDAQTPVLATYWMNRLQGQVTPEPLLVSLNPPAGLIDQARVLRRMVYHHPEATAAGERARTRQNELNGRRNTWFAGAWWGYGFHEDGVRSALAVAERFGEGL